MKTTNETRRLVVTGLLVAVTIMLSATPIGIINLGFVSATTSHIPIIIAGILEGPIVGGVVGLVFGLYTMFKAATAPAGILDPYFINPIISVLPRMLIGIFAALTYRFVYLLCKKSHISSAISAAIGSITNTIGVLGIFYIIYGSDINSEFMAQTGQSIAATFVTIALTSGTAEMIAAIILVTAIVSALKIAIYRDKKNATVKQREENNIK